MIGVAILGMGVVGSGVYETLKLNRELIARRAMDELEVLSILDLRDFEGEEFQSLVTHDFADIEHNDSIRVVVESMGGIKPAYEYTKRALMAGKHVVTSNKELVSRCGTELMHIAEQHRVNYMFEASVGGGAPIIRPLVQCMSANEIEEICGILNGTTNFSLTEMINRNVSLADAIKEAQRLGYAERDPSADVEGLDAARKICILANLACGTDIGVESVRCEGINGVYLEDVKNASSAGYAIKLLGRYVRLSEREVCAYVAPHLVPKTKVLGRVDGVLGGVMIRGNVVGEIAVVGAGAGKMPTASAVVADVIDAARHVDKTKNRGLWEGHVVKNLPPSALGGRMYVRADASGDLAHRIFGGAERIADDAFITPYLAAEELTSRMAEFRNATTVRSAFRVIESEVER